VGTNPHSYPVPANFVDASPPPFGAISTDENTIPVKYTVSSDLVEAKPLQIVSVQREKSRERKSGKAQLVHASSPALAPGQVLLLFEN
jgi:hypothetical protein